MIHTAWLFIIGCAMIGFLAPEFVIVFSARHYECPIAMNVWIGIAFGLIAASFTL